MNADKLKVIALGMGYEIIESRLNLGIFIREVEVGCIKYTPLTNAEQMVEIMEKLKKCLVYNDWEALTQEMYVLENKISEVVCAYAYEYFKGKA